jgi:DNA ligase (NAD+)
MSKLDAVKKDPVSAEGWSTDELETFCEMCVSQYYGGSNPIVSDEVFDYLESLLRKRKPSAPVLHGVGHDAAATTGSGAVVLPAWMGSLDKVRPSDGSKVLNRWLKVQSRGVGSGGGNVSLMPKYDGMAGILHSEGGKLCLFSRGDGRRGSDWTHSLNYIRIFKGGKLSSASSASPRTVRGELIMSRENFKKFGGGFSNARNLVAGLLNAKEKRARLLRLVDFVAYEIVDPGGMSVPHQLEVLGNCGFLCPGHVVPCELAKLTVPLLEGYYDEWRECLPYATDGVVVTADTYVRNLSKNPKYAFAFKRDMVEYADVSVAGVEWKVSKDGYLKPTVLLTPTRLGGVLISRATGNNARFIKDSGIGKGATIRVIRSGDVIPKIYEVLRPSSPDMPDVSCHWSDSRADLLVDDMSSSRLSRLVYFFKKIGTNGVSEKLLAKVVENSGFTDPFKIIRIQKETLASYPGFKSKSALNFVESIRTACARATWAQWIVAASVFGRGVGLERCESIFEACPELSRGECLAPGTVSERLMSRDGFQTKTVESVVSRLGGLSTLREELLSIGLSPWLEKKKKKKTVVATTLNTMTGFVVVFTGFRCKKSESVIVERGGKVSKSVTNSTKLLVRKDDSYENAKTREARKKDIPIVTREAFLENYNLQI